MIDAIVESASKDLKKVKKQESKINSKNEDQVKQVADQ
jgi:hypothetical protein